MAKQEYLPKTKTRKTKFEAWMCDKIIEVAQQGRHVAGMCIEIGIRSRDTFYRWLNRYPEFKEAYEYTKLVSQDVHEQLGFRGMTGQIKNFNFSSYAMIMNNKFPEEYKRTGNGPNTEINIGSINSIERLDQKALDEKIQQLQEKLDLIPSTPTEKENDDR